MANVIHEAAKWVGNAKSGLAVLVGWECPEHELDMKSRSLHDVKRTLSMWRSNARARRPSTRKKADGESRKISGECRERQCMIGSGEVAVMPDMRPSVRRSIIVHEIERHLWRAIESLR